MVNEFVDDRKTDLPGSPAGCATGDASIPLRSCAPFERIVVTTLNTVYEVIVLSGEDGDLLVRGGRFPEFCRARVAASTAYGLELKPETIEVGLRLELIVDGKAIVTSTVQAVRRVSPVEPECQ